MNGPMLLLIVVAMIALLILLVSVPVILVSVGWANSAFLQNRFPRPITGEAVLPNPPGKGRPKPPSTVLKGFPVRFAHAQFEAGADAVTLADHATGDLVSPDMYRDFLFPIHREIVASVKGPLILHVCGRTTDRLPYIARTQFAAFHFDSKNTLEEATAVAKAEGMALAGYINNPEVLYRGTPDDVRTMVFKAIEAGVEVIGPECAIPLRTPNRNLKALVEACREYAFG